MVESIRIPGLKSRFSFRDRKIGRDSVPVPGRHKALGKIFLSELEMIQRGQYTPGKWKWPFRSFVFEFQNSGPSIVRKFNFNLAGDLFDTFIAAVLNNIKSDG